MTTPRVMTTRERHAAAWRSLFEEFMKPPAERSELRARALMSGMRLYAWQREKLAELLSDRRVTANRQLSSYVVHFRSSRFVGFLQLVGRTPRLTLLVTLKEAARG